jgi:hypothetical protein
LLRICTLKAIRIGYTDSTGRRIAPQIVHPGFIVQNMYPLILPIFAYVKSEKKDLVWGFATFMEKDPSIQKVLLNKGIVPSHAKYNLIAGGLHDISHNNRITLSHINNYVCLRKS